MSSGDGGARRCTRGIVLAALGAAGALYVLTPAEVRGAETWKECVDEAFLGYNDCLMDSDGWFERKLCDLDWEFEVAFCTAKAVGEIRDAWNGEAA